MTKKSIFGYLILLVGIIGATFYFLNEESQVADVVIPSPSPAGITMRCYDNDHYLAVVSETQGGRDEGVVVYNREELIEPIKCQHYTGVRDFTLNLEPATFVFGLLDKYLVLDKGTGPSNRNLEVYDVETQLPVYEDNYADLQLVAPATLSYWRLSREPATRENCPDYATIRAQSLTPQIQTAVKYSLVTQQLTEGEIRCVATQ